MNPKQEKQQPKSKARTVWLALAAIILFGGIAWFSLRTTETPVQEPQEAQTQTLPPMKLTPLPPSMFVGRAREAYQVAQDIPEVLQQVQCYCGCKLSAGHENNLYCFTDGHGAGWAMCQDIALDARKLHDAGLSISQIREAIRVKYGAGEH